MSLTRAIADMKRFSQAGFSVEITFTDPSGALSVVVRGLVSKHSFSINPETGVPVNSRNGHVSIAESVLLDQEYPTRDANDNVDLKGHKVEWVDSSGSNYSYLIDDQWPSMTLGLIVCTLGDLNG
jgi:hypothetical protein